MESSISYAKVTFAFSLVLEISEVQALAQAEIFKPRHVLSLFA